jgi:hypothetical protein
MRPYRLLVSALAIAVFVVSAASQDKAAGDRSFSIGEGKLSFTAPEGWTKKQPANRIIEVEYAVLPVKGDETPGRFTAMGAGGSVEQNVTRWVGQFVGDAVKPKLDKLTVSGCEVQVVDLTGTYKDSPGGPFAGGKETLRDNYRMLGAIIATKDAGNYFVKLYGPKATVGENEAKFQELVKSLKVK